MKNREEIEAIIDKLPEIPFHRINSTFESQKEAYNFMKSNVGFLDPLSFIMFASENNLLKTDKDSKGITYKIYANDLKKRALKKNNRALLEVANAALIYIAPTLD